MSKKPKKYRQNKVSPVLFEHEMTLESLEKMGNPLEILKELLYFEQFRPILEPVFENVNRKSNAGRKPIDPVLMFKVMFLQRLYGLGDHQIEYQIKDRASFRKFLDIVTVEDVPDEKTVWKYKEILSQDGTFDRLFTQFNASLDEKGLILNEGKIIDASFVIAPRQRNSRSENAAIKRGEGGKLWQEEPGDSEREKKRKANKRRHKDTDARWTKKRGETFFGYKNHPKVCRKTKLIHGYDTTAANVHDSQRCASLIDENDRHEDVWLDSGYVGQEAELEEKRVNPIISDRPYRDHPLTEEQKQSNRTKSKVRCRIEHVFGFMEQTMGGLVFRGIGLVRAAANVALTNLVYNMCRFTQIVRCHVEWIKPKNAAVGG